MTSRWQWLLMHFSRKLWVRAGLISVLAVAAVLFAGLLKPVIPDELAATIGADSVGEILGILATSMLAVTTFSLTTMVSAYGAATSHVTPRATKLLREDTTTQNVLATFIGSFLFSLFGIVMLSTGLYGEQGRVMLFLVTVCVIFLIVGTLLRWIEHLSRLGRVDHTTDRVEAVATQAMRELAERPCLGGRALLDPRRDIPDDATPVYRDRIGYVQHVDIGELQDCAEEHDGQVFLEALPGTLVDPSRAVMWVTGIPDDVARNLAEEAFAIDHLRSFDQDPRFGLSVLAEIASRALSPAMNDPGTAIDVIGRSVRVLSHWTAPEAQKAKSVQCPRVWVPPLRVDDLFDDVFTPIARDGAALAEVHIRLQKALATLVALGGDEFRESAERHSRLALARAEHALHLEADRERVRHAARLVTSPGGR